MKKLVSKKNLQKAQNEVGFEMVKQMNRELHEEVAGLKRENEELIDILYNLVEDIHTPSRLGLSQPVNPNWETLNRAIRMVGNMNL